MRPSSGLRVDIRRSRLLTYGRHAAGSPGRSSCVDSCLVVSGGAGGAGHHVRMERRWRPAVADPGGRVSQTTRVGIHNTYDPATFPYPARALDQNRAHGQTSA